MSDLPYQLIFARLVGRLLTWAAENDHDVTLGDAYRDSRCPYGSQRSFHRRRLAIDLNLFIDGEYRRDTDAHRPIGEYWESLHPLCTWGGHFNDGNHYSFGEGKGL